MQLLQVNYWPEDWHPRHCFATLAMDLTAPFLGDMGLHMRELQEIRGCVRSMIELDPRILQSALPDMEAERLKTIERALRNSASDSSLEELRKWLAETYTYATTDRPNWTAYEWFFFEWSIHMRDGEDTVGCFADPRTVYESYHAFLPARQIKLRIKESRTRLLSKWDQSVFTAGSYTLDEDSEDENLFDPFAPARSSSNIYSFQLFWEYLRPSLSNQELERLWQALRRHFDGHEWTPDLLPPTALNRQVR